jgi:hypothetical protein
MIQEYISFSQLTSPFGETQRARMCASQGHFSIFAHLKSVKGFGVPEIQEDNKL